VDCAIQKYFDCFVVCMCVVCQCRHEPLTPPSSSLCTTLCQTGLRVTLPNYFVKVLIFLSFLSSLVQGVCESLYYIAEKGSNMAHVCRRGRRHTSPLIFRKKIASGSFYFTLILLLFNRFSIQQQQWKASSATSSKRK
jgi:hypothetical protein